MLSEALSRDKRRISNYELCIWPSGPSWILVGVNLDSRAIGIKAGNRNPHRITGQFDVSREDGIADFDIVECAQNRIGGHAALGADVPLEVADPEDEFGDCGGAGVEFEAKELVRVDGVTFETTQNILAAEVGEDFEDFAFEAFYEFEGDVKEVAGAAGGIEDAGFTERVVEGADGGDGFFGVILGFEAFDGGQHVGPVGAEGFDDGGDDEAFDVGAGGVVGAEAAAFGLVEGLFEEGAEDGGIDLAPVVGGGLSEFADFLAAERENGAGFEEFAVEAADLGFDGVGEAAGIHGFPELADEAGEVVGGGFAALEEVAEGGFGEEADILGEHGEEAAHEEVGGDFGRVAGGFEGFGDGGEAFGDGAGDAGGAAGGVEGAGVGPEGAEEGLGFGFAEVFEVDAEGLAIGELDVVAALAGEVGEDFDDVADVEDEDEGGPTVVGGEGAGVGFGLAAGVLHEDVPGAAGAAAAAAGGFGGGDEGELFGEGFVAAGLAGLLGFEDEGVAFVKVDAAGGGGAVGLFEVDAAFEDVVVVFIGFVGGLGLREVEGRAEFDKKKGEVGAFLAAFAALPAGDEALDGGVRCRGGAGLLRKRALVGGLRGYS